MGKKYHIYKITNIANNKVYIGQSINPKDRWRNHLWYANNKQEQYIHCAMAKYGVDKFTFEVIDECNSQQEVDEAEDKYINQYNSRDKEFGYNLKPGGHLRGEWKQSEETKKMMSEKWHSDHPREGIEKTAAANRGQKRAPASEERKRKIGEANAIALKGKKQSQEMIQKRIESIALKYGDKTCNAPGCDRTDGYKYEGIRYCQQHIQRLIKYGTLKLPERVAHNKGQPLSEETKKKLSESLKGREVHNTTKFTEDQITLILSDNRSSRKLAIELNVGRKAIERIRRNKNY